MKETILFFVLIIFFSSCREDPEPDPCLIDGQVFTKTESIQQMRDYLVFDVGTWWVYEEETTGELDTVEVFYSWSGIAQDVNEAFRIDTYSSFEDFNIIYTFNESFDHPCISDQACICLPVKRSKTKPGEFVGASNAFLFPVVVGNYLYAQGGGIIEIEDLFEEFQISGMTFPETIVIRNDTNLSEEGDAVRFWISKHHGIIKKELINTNSIWNLKNYYIVI